MAAITFTGRTLYLSDDPTQIAQQLAGQSITLEQAQPLRDDVSTDEMTSQEVCARPDMDFGAGFLNRYRAGTELPIGNYDIRNYGCAAIVAGKRYGKGSSREHSPMAHLGCGIRLIIAENFERIFRQNCDNLGIFTVTDFSFVARVEAGEAIPIEELVAGREPLAAELLRQGGLLAYGRNQNNTGEADSSCAPVAADVPQTLVEKIIHRHAVSGAPMAVGDGGFIKTDWRFSHEYYTGMIAHILHENFGSPAPLVDKPSILLFEDHLTFARRSDLHVNQGLLPGVDAMSARHQAFGLDYGLVNHGYLPQREGSEGICHALMIERYALPGQVVVGTDSHTTHSGALGCLAFGVGSTDMAASMVSGKVRFTKPASILVQLDGHLPSGLTAKDVVLHLLALPQIKAGAGLAKVFEFAGSAVTAMSIDERATLTNMTAELGGFTGIVAPDEKTVEFIQQRRGVSIELEPWMHSDPGAHYDEIVTVDCSRLGIYVAAPGDPSNGIELNSLVNPIAVDIAYGGSCTAGKREDFDYYFEVCQWADQNGLRVPEHITFFLQFGTLAVRDYCVEQGYLEVFERVGIELLVPSCGACAGCGPGSSVAKDQVTVSAINRNFPGRSGPGGVWLASPYTVAASAFAGRLVSFEQLQQGLVQ